MKMNSNEVYYAVVNIDKNMSSHDQAINVLFNVLKRFNIDRLEIDKDINGKPYFVDSNIKFNYSHSKSFIAVAVSLNEVGIDIEDSDRIISDRVSNRYLNGINDNRLSTWVKYESFSKLKGLGLGIDFNSIDLSRIIESNKLIENSQYVCSIYGDNKDLSFIQINC